MFRACKKFNEEFIHQSVFKTAYNGPIHPGMHRNIFSFSLCCKCDYFQKLTVSFSSGLNPNYGLRKKSEKLFVLCCSLVL